MVFLDNDYGCDNRIKSREVSGASFPRKRESSVLYDSKMDSRLRGNDMDQVNQSSLKY
jgi:hypothetical protein